MTDVINAEVNHDFRAGVKALEGEMFQLPQVEIGPVHYFAEGLYAREITIPKGVLLTGKVHKYSHLNIISKGIIDVMTEDGPVRLTAPCTIVSQPNTKRVGYAIEETVWTTIHATEETEIENIESALVYDDYPDGIECCVKATAQIEEV